jgi:hypothetical protein
MGHTQTVWSVVMKLQRLYRLVAAGDHTDHDHSKFISVVSFASAAASLRRSASTGRSRRTRALRQCGQLESGMVGLAFCPDGKQILVALIGSKSVAVAVQKEWTILIKQDMASPRGEHDSERS